MKIRVSHKVSGELLVLIRIVNFVENLELLILFMGEGNFEYIHVHCQ